MRPSPAMAGVTGHEPGFECAKVEGLRFELEQAVWKLDAECTAQRIIEDGEYSAESIQDE